MDKLELNKLNKLDLNKILKRENDTSKMKEFLVNFDSDKKDLSLKRGIYVYGEPGTGKTTFVMDILKEARL